MKDLIMKNKTIMLAGLALAVSAFTSIAQPGPGDGPPSRRGGPPGGPGGDQQRPLLPPIVAALDANHDGVIDAQEIANASAALKTLDKNNDGQLTRDEMMPPQGGPRGQELLPAGPGSRGGFRGGPGGPQGRGHVEPPPGIGDNSGQQAPLPPRSPIVAALDANHDGVIDAQEIAHAIAALKTLDRNGDGQLTPDEYMPPRQGQAGLRGDPRGGFRGGFRGGPGGPQGPDGPVSPPDGRGAPPPPEN
jgi:hypothetical protein